MKRTHGQAYVSMLRMVFPIEPQPDPPSASYREGENSKPLDTPQRRQTNGQMAGWGKGHATPKYDDVVFEKIVEAGKPILPSPALFP